MSFRKPKTDLRHHRNDWRAWVDERRAELAGIGLPAELYVDESHWSDFLQNGHLHWHESSGFEFAHLPAGQLGALHRFLEREYGSDEQPLPLLQWVRFRCVSE